jgi:ABC-type glycerol-3-phosphate transport system substrate-binding protein
MYSNGGSYVDDTNHPTRFTADSPAVMEAARFRWDLTHKYHVAPTTSEVQAFGFANSTQSMFLNGQVAMMVSGVWNVPTFLEKKDLEFDVARFPMSPKGGKGWTTGGSGFAVCSQSKNKELAWKVAKELVSPSALSQLAATGMIQPALMRLSKSEVFLKAPGPAHKAILLDMPQYSHYSPFMANWSELMDSSYTNSMDRVWLGDKTPEEVLPVVTKNINEKYFSKKSENP